MAVFEHFTCVHHEQRHSPENDLHDGARETA
jgi:hypothetical protein